MICTAQKDVKYQIEENQTENNKFILIICLHVEMIRTLYLEAFPCKENSSDTDAGINCSLNEYHEIVHPSRTYWEVNTPSQLKLSFDLSVLDDAYNCEKQRRSVCVYSFLYCMKRRRQQLLLVVSLVFT